MNYFLKYMVQDNAIDKTKNPIAFFMCNKNKQKPETLNF